MALNSWDKRMAYGTQVQEEVKAREAQIKNFFSNVDVAMRKASSVDEQTQKWHDEEIALSKARLHAAESIHAAFLDSVNTRGALDAVSDLIKATNTYLAARSGDNHMPQSLLLRQCASCVTKTLSVMGLTPYSYDKLGMDDTGTGDSVERNRTEKLLDAITGFRDDIRQLAKSGASTVEYLKCCDGMRDGAMVDLGVRLEDVPDGRSVWKLDDPGVLKKERDEKIAAIAAAARKKLSTKIENLKKDITKFENLAQLPSVQESLSEKYSKFDSDGNPTHDVEGTPLEGKAIDKAKKDVEKAKKVRLPLEKRIAEKGPTFLEDMKRELAELESTFS